MNTYNYKHPQKNTRKVFNVDGVDSMAAGIIFYKFINDIPYYLFMEMSGNAAKFRWEDPGGKTDHDDKDILDTAAREVSEEFNALFSNRDLSIIKRNKALYLKAIETSTKTIRKIVIDNDVEPIVFHTSKYVIFMAPFPEQYNVYNIGNIEINHHDPNTVYTIHRRCQWLSVDDLFQLNMHEVHPRIRELINILKLINPKPKPIIKSINTNLPYMFHSTSRCASPINKTKCH